MFRVLFIAILLLIQSTFGQGQQPWWKRNNLRVIQVNLPAYEAATLNPDSLVADLAHHSANTVIINAGGIMAFYPTELPFHYTNPYMKPNMLREVIEKSHMRGIKVIVRFDFSRVHESIFKQHPDWCYVSPAGERIINTDMYVASINGPYVQQHAFSIINEVLQKFPIDGIFLNMPGYQTNNPYENKYHGIDQNIHDKAAFEKFSGKALPTKEDRNDPVYLEYLEFKKLSVEDWSRRLYEMVHKRSDQIAICTYSDKYVDIIRHEAQTNSLPYWPYTSSDNVSNAVNSYPSHIISNASIQQISFQSRYNAVEPEETAIRLYENIANGSGLDMSMMGDMRGYEDERNFETFRKVYGFHKNNEKYYGDYSTVSRIAVIAPGAWPSGDPMQEYRGIQLMLKESHVQFDIIENAQIENLADRLKQYRLIILPDIVHLSEKSVEVLKQLAGNGAHLLATNKSFSDNAAVLKEVFGVTAREMESDGSGHYLDVSDHHEFPRLSQQTMVFLKFNVGKYQFDGTQTLLPLLTKGRPGPPEIIGGHEASGFSACSVNQFGKGKAAIMPFNIGKLYYLHGYEQHKNILLDVIGNIYPEAFDYLKTNAHPRVEMIVKNFRFNTGNQKRTDADGTIIHLINITGFSGNTYFPPLPVEDIRFSTKLETKPSKVYTLSDKKPVRFEYRDKTLTATVNKLNEYEAVVCEW